MTDHIEKRLVVSVFPDDERSQFIHNYLQNSAESWSHIPITGMLATEILQQGTRMRQALGRNTTAIRFGEDLSERLDFSTQISSTPLRAMPQERYLVISPSLVPLDLVRDENGNWGERTIFSHLLVGSTIPNTQLLDNALSPTKLPLQTYLLVCPMAMDRALPRHLQDIIVVALGFERSMPVEVWLQPSLPRTIQGLKRDDVSWLHLDTHGSRDGTMVMLYPTREGSQMVGSDVLPEAIETPFVMLVGCALTASHESIGQALLLRGVKSVFGPCAIFQSLGIANSEEEQANWYRTFYSALLSGNDVGSSLLKARTITKGGLLKFGWLIMGSSLLHFGSHI